MARASKIEDEKKGSDYGYVLESPTELRPKVLRRLEKLASDDKHHFETALKTYPVPKVDASAGDDEPVASEFSDSSEDSVISLNAEGTLGRRQLWELPNKYRWENSETYHCANEHQKCKCVGNVVYTTKCTSFHGCNQANWDHVVEHRYNSKHVADVTGEIWCDNTHMGGDPNSGFDKQCFCHPYWMSDNNYCVSADGTDLQETDYGFLSQSECQTECEEISTCSAYEYYQQAYGDGRCFLVLTPVAASKGSDGRQYADAKCHVKPDFQSNDEDRILTRFDCEITNGVEPQWYWTIYGPNGGTNAYTEVEGRVFEQDCQTEKCFDAEGERGNYWLTCGKGWREADELILPTEHVLIDVKTVAYNHYDPSCPDDYETVAHWDSTGEWATSTSGARGHWSVQLCTLSMPWGDVKARGELVVKDLVVTTSSSPPNQGYSLIGSWDTNNKGKNKIYSGSDFEETHWMFYLHMKKELPN